MICMRGQRLKVRLLSLATSLALCWLTAAEAASERGPVTGLPLPRFVSTKANPANVRIGPGTDYPVKFTIVRSGLPLEITAEFENWRRVRDWNGDEGWMLGGLLAGKRTALVSPWSGAQPVTLHESAADEASVTAIVHPKVLLRIEECDGDWCVVTVKGSEGYIRQTELWGAYPREVF
jgi:SH3-like domain-containing protein